MDDKSYKICKYIMIVFNLLFMLAGFGFIGIGAWLAIDGNNSPFATLVGDTGLAFQYVGYALIGLGCIIAFVAFLGCCGAWTENTCLLGFFNCFLIIFLLFTVGLAVTCFALPPYLKVITEVGAKGVITTYSGTPLTAAVDDIIDSIQEDHKCCGFNNGDDYADSAYNRNPLTTHIAPWPSSCCTTSGVTACQAFANVAAVPDGNTDTYAKTGCFDSLFNLIKDYLTIVGGVSIGIAVLELLAIIFSCCISCGAGKHGTARSVKPWG